MSEQQSHYRPVPRNIDRPNRSAEYGITFIVVYYGVMFLTQSPIMAIGSTVVALYAIYKVTLNKPEGQAFRLVYRYFKIGKMIPGSKFVKKFEI